MGSSKRRDPLPVFCFKVEIDGLEPAAFEAVDGLHAERSLARLVLHKGWIPDDGLLSWRKEFLAGRGSRRNATLTRTATAGRIVARWRLSRVLPAGAWGTVRLGGAPGSSGFLVEKAEISVESVERLAMAIP
jgi:hypothetical protein